MKSFAQPTRGTAAGAAPQPSGILQRACACGQHAADGECTACQRKRQALRRSPLAREADDLDGRAAPPIVQQALGAAGRPLDPSARAAMEQGFGHDFAGVRVHTDAVAAESARAVNARAYTVGRDIVFGAGQYAPHSTAGRRLIAHELAHVMQQDGVPAHGSPVVGPSDGPLEREADAVAAAVGQDEPAVSLTHAEGAAVQRDLATEPPADVRAQAELTPAQIRTALAFNRSRFSTEQTRQIQDIIGTEPTGTWTEADIIAVGQIQEEYNLDKDGMIGAETFRFIDREQRLEGAARSDAQCLISFFSLGFPATFQDIGGGQHRLEGHFQVRAQLPTRCDCSDFEYRQFIRGRFTLRRGGVENDLAGIFNDLPAGQLTADFREDGDTTDNPVNYGHRDQPADNNPEDHYIDDNGNDDQADGCRYRNEDFPGATLNTQAGDEYDAAMEFRGEIQRNDRAARTLQWTAIRGTFRVP